MPRSLFSVPKALSELQLHPEAKESTVVQSIRDHAETRRHQIVAGLRKLWGVEKVDCFRTKLQAELSSQSPSAFQRGVHVGNLASAKGIPAQVASTVGGLHEPEAVRGNNVCESSGFPMVRPSTEASKRFTRSLP